MEWAAIWSWVLTVLQWCFYAVVFYIAVRWWIRSMAIGAKIRFIEAKIDALLNHFDIGFEEEFRQHIAETLRKNGVRAAREEYILITGDGPGKTELFFQDLADEEAKSSQVGPPYGPLDADELHELAAQMFQRPRRKPRQKRK